MAGPEFRFGGGIPEQPPEKSLAKETKDGANASPDSSKEKKEAERALRSFEYRDAKGELLGSIDVEIDDFDTDLLEYDADKPEPEKVGVGRAIHSLILRGMKDGKPTETDVLRLANPHGSTLYVRQDAAPALTNYHHDQAMMRTIVPLPQTPYEFGILLHELGHADQYTEEKFDALSPFYGTGAAALRDRIPEMQNVQEMVAQIVDAAPEAVTLLKPETVSRLSVVESELSALRESIAAAEDIVKERRAERNGYESTAMAKLLGTIGMHAEDRAKALKEMGEQSARLQQRLADALAETDARMRAAGEKYKEESALYHESGLKEFLMVPMKMMERDATARAYRWLRTLKNESGVDLFAAHKVPLERTFAGRVKEFKSACGESVDDLYETDADGTIVTSVKENLSNEALGSYDAQHPPKYPKAEKKESERLLRSFEYRDAEGRRIGAAEVDFFEGEPERDYELRADWRKLKSFVIRGEKEGKPTEIDVLALARAEDCEIRVFEEPVGGAHYLDIPDEARAPMPEYPVDVAVLLHELGHRDQYRDKRFSGVTPHNIEGRITAVLKDEPLASLRARAEKITADIPELAALLPQTGDAADAASEAETRKALASITEIPSKMMESDASDRALRWIETIKEQTGVDLSVKHAVPLERLTRGQRAKRQRHEARTGLQDEADEAAFAAERKKTVVTDIHEELYDYGLASYDAYRPLRGPSPDAARTEKSE